MAFCCFKLLYLAISYLINFLVIHFFLCSVPQGVVSLSCPPRTSEYLAINRTSNYLAINKSRPVNKALADVIKLS